jgi:hypothetical protein
MANRGALFIVWGENVAPVLDRAVNSFRHWHPELPVHVERLDAGTDPIRGLLYKSRMAALSPFEETVFLDADTVVLGRLDYAFDRAQRHGIACAINECPWARRYGDPALSGDHIEYNTGVLFFTRAARRLFDAWSDNAEALDSSIEWIEDGEPKRMPFNDQAGFAKAMEDTGMHPFVLPLNWNFRPPFHRGYFGPLKIWHDYGDVPDWILRENEKYADPKARHLRFYPLKIG